MPEEIPGYVAGTWDLDPVHSHIGFTARHLMVSKVRGKFGKFDVQIVTAGNPLDSTVTVSIDTASVDTGNEMRDNDLRSERFLDTANHPVMTFTSADVTPDGDKYWNDFGVSFNAPIPGGVMVSEKIAVEIEGEAVLRKEE